MNPKYYLAKNGFVTLERLAPSGYYLITCRIGDALEKALCDTYRDAIDTFNEFKRAARGN